MKIELMEISKTLISGHPNNIEQVAKNTIVSLTQSCGIVYITAARNIKQFGDIAFQSSFAEGVSLEQAKAYVQGGDFIYGIGIPLYTDMTSSIREQSDLLFSTPFIDIYVNIVSKLIMVDDKVNHHLTKAYFYKDLAQYSEILDKTKELAQKTTPTISVREIEYHKKTPRCMTVSGNTSLVLVDNTAYVRVAYSSNMLCYSFSKDVDEWEKYASTLVYDYSNFFEPPFKRGMVIHGKLYNKLTDLAGQQVLDVPVIMTTCLDDLNNSLYITGTSNKFGSSTNNPVTYDPNTGEVTCNKNKLKIGRIIKALWPKMADEDIEKIVSQWKSEFTIDTNIVKTSCNISKVYGMGSVGGSCMSDMEADTFDIYEDAGCEIAYIEKDGCLLARALLFKCIDPLTGKEYTTLDRIYFEKEIHKLTLKQWANDNGLTRVSRLKKEGIEMLVTASPIESNYEYVPYADNFYYVVKKHGEYYLATNYNNNGHYVHFDELRETNGGSSEGNIAIGGNRVYCCDTGNYVDIDDAYYCETDGTHYEYDDDLVYIDGYGHYRDDDDTVAYDEYNEEWAFLDDLTYIDCDDIYVSNTEGYILAEFGTYGGEYIREEDAVYAADMGLYGHVEDCELIVDLDEYYYQYEGMYQHEDGKWHSYPEEKNKEEEVA